MLSVRENNKLVQPVVVYDISYNMEMKNVPCMCYTVFRVEVEMLAWQWH